jgi:predicted nucleic acid-binding protein
MVSSGFLRIALEIEDQADGIESLLARYGKRMDLADACVVRMSELTRQCRVFTLDRRDFAVYRRNGRNVIPLLAPDP